MKKSTATQGEGISRKKGTNKVPKVGLFFLVGRKPFVEGIPWTENPSVSGFRTYAVGHPKFWSRLQDLGAAPAGIPYEDIPRGRVNYMDATDRFTLLADRCIIKSNPMVRKIMASLGLPTSTRVTTDSHYKCAVCMGKVPTAKQEKDDWDFCGAGREPAAALRIIEGGIIPAAMRVHTATLNAGISRTKEFEKKGLAQFAINVGTKCGHGCQYCSTGAMLRMHPSFKAAGENPFESGYAIVDPETPGRVARDAVAIRRRGLIQLCTTVDAWSPEAQEHDLGRRCLVAVLSQPDWTVRILTKNAAVKRDFDLIDRYRDRVLVGLSLTATEDKSCITSVTEPWASPISERMKALEEAHTRGLRTYGMLCPLLPGVSDSPGALERLINFVLDCGAEEVFVEPVNGRGPCLVDTEKVIRAAGFPAEADALAAVRHGVGWSAYATGLLRSVQDALRKRSSLHKLRFLLYPSRLTDGDETWIRSHPEGVKWLGKN